MVQDGRQRTLPRRSGVVGKTAVADRRRTGTKSHCRTGIRCSRECVTIFHATGICEWVERHWNLRCAFVLPAMEIMEHPRCTSSCGNAGKSRSAGQPFTWKEASGIMRVISIFRCCRPSERNCRNAGSCGSDDVNAEFVEQSSKIRKKNIWCRI